MSWFTKKPQQEQSLFQNKVELPPNFAEQLMYLELEIETPNVSIETITKLLELYGVKYHKLQLLYQLLKWMQVAVEYFSTIKDDKYLIFKNKCQSLLLKPNVVQTLNSNDPQQQSQPEKLCSNTIVKKQEIQNYITQQDCNEEVQRFLHNERNNQQKRKTLIENEFYAQENRLADRMIKRVRDADKFMQKSQSLQTFQRIDIKKFDQIKPQTDQILENKNQFQDLLGIMEVKESSQNSIQTLLPDSGVKKISMSECKQPTGNCVSEFSLQTDSSMDTQLERKLTYNVQGIIETGTEEQQQKSKPGMFLPIEEEKKSEQIQEIPVTINFPSQQYLILQKEKKVRDQVNQNHNLQRQKAKLLQKNILPF